MATKTKKKSIQRPSYGLECTSSKEDNPNEKCGGTFVFQDTEKVVRLGCPMIRTNYVCNVCGADSIRHRST